MPELRERYAPDLMIANTENLTQGKGPVPSHLDELEALGFDVFTAGNHTFAHIAELRPYIDRPDSPQIRALNYFEHPSYPVPGSGYRIIEKNGSKALVVSLLGSTFMGDDVDNAFLAMDRLLASLEARGEKFDAVVVDYHRETTSEMALMGEYLRGRASLLYGTHTHVQTNDERILGGHTGFITDIGATCALDSAIGATYGSFMPSALTGVRFFSSKQEPDLGR